MWDILVTQVAEVLRLLNSVVGSYGWTLIILGIAIRIVTWPLNLKQMRASKQMAALQPQMEAIRKKYKDDREKQTQAQMELYKQAGINPLGGCLPLLIQFPILILLYNAIETLRQTTPEFAAPFWWLPSLAQPEGIPPIWPFTDFFAGAPAAPYFIPILILLMVITSLMQQQMMTMASNDPQAKSMQQSMLIMTVMFPIFFMTLPAGLTLYYVVQNIAGIVLQYLWLGPGKLPLPNPPWLHDEAPVAVSPNGTAVLATEPQITTASANSSASNEDEEPVAVPKRRTNVRNKKKRRG